MKRLTLLLILVALAVAFSSRQLISSSRAQQPTFNIGILFGPVNVTNPGIIVTVNSTYQISTVKAKVQDREFLLTQAPCAPDTGPNCWVGRILMEGLPRGPYQMTVTATDVFNNSGTRQWPFTYDLLPTLTILTGPIDYTVVRQSVHVKVSCTDDDPAGCKALSIPGLSLQLNKEVFEGDVSLAQYQGQSFNFCVSGIDSANQVVQQCRLVYVETSPLLTEVLAVGGKIWDVQDDRVLFSEKRNGVDVLKIHNRTTGLETESPLLTNKPLNYSGPASAIRLTPKGAIFVASTSNIMNNVYEWRDSQLIDLGMTDSPSSLLVSRGYAFWTGFTALMLRDLVAATNTEIKLPVGVSRSNNDNFLLPNGEIILRGFLSPTVSHLYRYRNGELTQLTNKDTRDWYPVSDGKNIVFSRFTGPPSSSTQIADIILLTDAGETVLATGGDYYQLPSPSYSVNNGWIAYPKPSGPSTLHVWLRSPSGQEEQKSFFQARTYSDSLSPAGNLTLNPFNSGKRYLPVTGQVPIAIGSSLGFPFWQDNQLFIVIGRSLFRYTPYTPLASVSAASFSGSALATESITSVFGTLLASATQAAMTEPLPVTLAGTRVAVKDSRGTERLAPLFFVSPTQINLQIPQGTASGSALFTITGSNGAVQTGTVSIATVAPGLFTANASGQGVPAATLLRIKANGEQVYEPVAVFDSAQSKFVARPITFGPASEQDYLILFGTGLRYHSGLSNVSVTLGGENAPVLYAGAQGNFLGLDQINVALPRSLAGRGDLDLQLTVDQQSANAVRIRIE